MTLGKVDNLVSGHQSMKCPLFRFQTLGQFSSLSAEKQMCEKTEARSEPQNERAKKIEMRVPKL